MHETCVLLFKLVQATDPAPQNGAAPVGIFAGEIEAAVSHRADRGYQCKLREPVQAARHLGIEKGFGAKVLYFPRKLDFEGGGIDLLNQADAAPAGAKRTPEVLDIGSERVHCAQAGNDDAPGHFFCNSRSI